MTNVDHGMCSDTERLFWITNPRLHRENDARQGRLAAAEDVASGWSVCVVTGDGEWVCDICLSPVEAPIALVGSYAVCGGCLDRDRSGSYLVDSGPCPCCCAV